MIVWERSGDVYYARVTAPSGLPHFYMIVESLGPGWDWGIWPASGDRTLARHGIAATVQKAMREAEAAVTVPPDHPPDR